MPVKGGCRSSDTPTMVLSVLAFALFSSAKWTMLVDNAELATTVTLVMRLSGILTFAFVACISFDRTASLAKIEKLASILVAMYFATLAAITFLEAGALLTILAYLNAIFHGCANALLFLLCAYLFALNEPKTSAILFAAAQVCTASLTLAMTLLGVTALFVVRNAFLLVGTALTVFLIRRQAPVKEQDQIADQHERPSFSTASEVFPKNPLDWVIILAAAFVFHNLYGLIAQVSSLQGGSAALFDVGTDAILVVFDLLVLAFLYICRGRFEYPPVLVVVTLLYSTGFALYPSSWQDGGLLAGSLVRSGFDCDNILIWALLARKAYENPKQTLFYFSLCRAVASPVPGRTIGSSLLSLAPTQLGLVEGVCEVALWMISLFGIVAFLLVYNRGIASPIGPFSEPDEALPKDQDDVGRAQFADEIDAYDTRINRFADELALSQREREVLLEMLHGLTRDRIAKKIYLSPETVKNYQRNIYKKASVSSKQELIELFEGRNS